MKKEMTFSNAFASLEKLVHEIEDDAILVDQLANKVKEANELIEFCELKLRGIDKELDQLTKPKATSRKKKVDTGNE
jgi:exodeoxyribonuclease VII small subunit